MTRRLPSLPTLCYGALFLLFMIGLFHAAVTHPDTMSQARDKSVSLADDWITADGQVVSLLDLSALDAGENLLFHPVPADVSDSDSLNFDSHNVRFSLRLGNHELYSYSPAANLTGAGNGDTFHSVSLSQTYAGETLVLAVEPIYPHSASSSFESVVIAPENLYYRLILHEHGVSFALSVMIVFFGATILLLWFAIPPGREKMALPALGVATILIGLWTAIETSIPTLILGHAEVLRVLDYYLIPLAEYPFIVFLNSSTTSRRKRGYEYASFAAMALAFIGSLFYRLVLGLDLHSSPLFPACYFFHSLLIVVMLIDNMRYHRSHRTTKHNLLLQIGVCIFLACVMIDLVTYQLLGQGYADNGFFIRIGVVVIVILLFTRIVRRVTEEQRSIASSRFINELLQYSLSARSPEQIIAQMLEYLGQESDAERIYIFEEGTEGHFLNSYEWCAPGIRPEKEILQNVPFVGLLDTWFEEFGKFDYVLIDDLEAYREKSEPMYEFAKLLHVQTHLSGPLIIDGDYIGFFGIDNPAKERMSHVSYSIRLIAFFMAVMLRQRNTQKLLRQYSYRDQMTGVMNRRALEEYVDHELPSLSGIGVLM